MKRSVIASLLWIVLRLSCCEAWALTDDQARHLLLRTGEQLSQKNLAQLRTLDRRQALTWVLRNHAKASKHVIRPGWLEAFRALDQKFSDFRQLRTSPKYIAELGELADALDVKFTEEHLGERVQPYDKKDAQSVEIFVNSKIAVAAHHLHILWLRAMYETTSPFTERMAFFWHGHFTTSFLKVPKPDLLIAQNTLLRSRGLSSFRELLLAVTHDGAMLVFLDGKDNVRGQPNENYARELLELFTIGEGEYTEQDVKEIARALTGIRSENGVSRVDPALHDVGVKSFLGTSGNFGPADVIEVLLKHKKMPPYIVRKFWREFVSPVSDEVAVRKWVKRWSEKNFDLTELVRIVLTSDEFYAPGNRMSLVKSPVEFSLGFFQIFQQGPASYVPLVLQNRILGQELFEPPDVRGWIGGEKWITTTTWMARQKAAKDFMQVALGMLSPQDKMELPLVTNYLTDEVLTRWRAQFEEKNWRAQAAFLLVGERDVADYADLNDRSFLLELLISPGFNLK